MPRSIRWLLLLALGLACRPSSPPTVAGAPLAATPEIDARIQRITRDLRGSEGSRAPGTLAERMRRERTPGMSIAVVNDFRIEWARGFGVKESGNDDAVDDETVFQAASISQAMFALAVLRMVEAGRLDLDADVNVQLRAWKVPPIGGWQPRITLRQLLGHSAALTVPGFSGYRRGEPLPSLPQILNGEPPANNAAVRVVGLPGLAPRYSGGGTTIAQLLVTEVLQQPFASIMHDWLLAPLEMQHSTYAQPLPEDGRFEPAPGHLLDLDVLPGNYRVHPEAAAAGLWTTPTDLARAMLAVMHAAGGREDGPLPARWIAEMLTPQTAPHTGLGFFLRGSGEAKRFGHGGANVGYRAELVGYERLGKGAVVMINSEASTLVGEVMNAIAREYAWPGFSRSSAAVGVKLSVRALRKLAGAYRTSSGSVLVFRVTGEVLELEATGQPALALVARSATEFGHPELELSVRFHQKANGRIESVTLEQPGAPVVTATPAATPK
jgi:CubicO group peptidase (beta-lactamase class C family)